MQIPTFSFCVWKPRLSKWQDKILILSNATLWFYLLLMNKKELLSLICFNSFSLIWFPLFSLIRQDFRDDVWFMCSSITINSVYCTLKFQSKEYEKGGGAPTPSAPPQQEVCCAHSLGQVEAELCGRAGSVTLRILLTLWWDKASPCDTLWHPVTLWVFLSADSTPQPQQWRWGSLSCVTPTTQTAPLLLELALLCTLIIWPIFGCKLDKVTVAGISGKRSDIADDKWKTTMKAELTGCHGSSVN